jgi:uncharacterized protein YecT (DUF1311 family)
MNRVALAEYQAVDAELNRVYARIIKEYAGESAFLHKLRAAQRAWIAFRDAHVEALFPAAGKERIYGSIYPTCRYQALTTLTRERAKELLVWIEGVDETDACRGSRRHR